MNKKSLLYALMISLLIFPIKTFGEEQNITTNSIREKAIIESAKGKLIDSIDTIRVRDVEYYSLTDIVNILGYNMLIDNDAINIVPSDLHSIKETDFMGAFGLEKDMFNYNMDVTAKGAVVLEDDCDRIIYQKNAYKKLFPASTTKILTTLIALEKGNMSDVVTVGEAVTKIPADSRKVNLKPGDKLTLEELIYGVMLYSGNDCAIAIAEYISGSVEEFAILMNNKAKEVGAVNSNFVNPHGYHDENHYTTPLDLGKITLAALQNSKFRAIVNTPSYTVKYKNKQGNEVVRTWKNTNRFVRNDQNYNLDGIIGGKTGYTSKAGYCLVNVTIKEGHTYVSVILNDGAFERYYDTENLINKAYNLRLKRDTEVIEKIELVNVDSTIKYNNAIIHEVSIFKNNMEYYASIDAIKKIYGYDILKEQHGDIKIYLNETFVEFYRLKPIIYKNTVLVPVSEIIDDLNLKLDWDGENNSLNVISDNNIYSLPLKGDYIIVNGKEETIDKKMVVGTEIYTSIDFINRLAPDKISFTTNDVLKLNSIVADIISK